MVNSLQSKMGFKEFVALTAALISLTALSIDAILPALSHIREEFNIADPNRAQFLIGSLFLGFCFGQLFFGPIADSYGRKGSIYGGLFIFIIGSLMGLFAPNFNIMIAGRILQGFGAAATRVVTTAMVRDCYSGREMARVMSFVMAVFILVPAIAPLLGQGVLMVASWHYIFVMFLAMAVLNLVWMHLRIDETLPAEKRRPFTFEVIFGAMKEVVCHKVALCYTICAGLVFGCLIAYLTTSQQLFQEYYEAGDMFAVYFGVIALVLGVASMVNSSIVRQYGMRRISHYALLAQVIVTAIFCALCYMMPLSLPFYAFMIFIVVFFFFMGMLFGNLNAAALEPMGHIAGIASAVIGSLSSFISLSVGSAVGQAYDGTPLPLAIGFFCLAFTAFVVQLFVYKIPDISSDEDA